MGTSILGNRVQRVEDVRMLTSGGVYVDDLSLDNAAWLTYVRSTEAHARHRLDRRRRGEGRAQG